MTKINMYICELTARTVTVWFMYEFLFKFMRKIINGHDTVVFIVYIN